MDLGLTPLNRHVRDVANESRLVRRQPMLLGSLVDFLGLIGEVFPQHLKHALTIHFTLKLCPLQAFKEPHLFPAFLELFERRFPVTGTHPSVMLVRGYNRRGKWWLSYAE